jgi:hypothetical protein
MSNFISFFEIIEKKTYGILLLQKYLMQTLELRKCRSTSSLLQYRALKKIKLDILKF